MAPPPPWHARQEPGLVCMKSIVPLCCPTVSNCPGADPTRLTAKEKADFEQRGWKDSEAEDKSKVRSKTAQPKHKPIKPKIEQSKAVPAKKSTASNSGSTAADRKSTR